MRCFARPLRRSERWIAAMRDHIVSFTVLALSLLQAWVPAALCINLVGLEPVSRSVLLLSCFPLVLPAAWPGLSPTDLGGHVLGLAVASMSMAFGYCEAMPRRSESTSL
jgi:hypothetical protein